MGSVDATVRPDEKPEYPDSQEERASLRWFPSGLYLVDVAWWQTAAFHGREVCDWDAAWEHGCVGAYVRRSHGREVATSGREHVANLAPTPIARGDYHFVECLTWADARDPRPQAETFAQEIGELQPGDLIPAIDYEGKKGTVRYPRLDWLVGFADAVEGHLGVRPTTLYMQWWLKRFLSEDVHEHFDLWLAAGGGDPEVELDPHEIPTVEQLDARWKRGKYARRCPVPSHWPEWALHQKVGHLPWYRDGVGRIDINTPRHWLGTLARLRVGG